MGAHETMIPVLRLWDRVLVTLQGDVTDDVAAQMRDDVLEVIHRRPARGLVLDITGLLTLDSHLCLVLSNIAAAARLMGTPTVISGMSAQTAHTLETMGVKLAGVHMAATAEVALEMLGVAVTLAEDASGARAGPPPGLRWGGRS
ncbi:MAG TPA: STAS domain-containing protein [Polyangiaceae bacterium]|nr:STAS domain-containing protein [Polyangiaceae bacterium]